MEPVVVRSSDLDVIAKVCEGGAGLHPQGGAEGGAEVTVCEGNSLTSQPDGLPATG
jgi:hypothetical protein